MVWSEAIRLLPPEELRHDIHIFPRLTAASTQVRHSSASGRVLFGSHVREKFALGPRNMISKSGVTALWAIMKTETRGPVVVRLQR
jgi:hypothetical protein